jgi:molybdopterin converting factor subunit 1
LKVRVLYFAQLAEIAGRREETYILEAGATAGLLFRRIGIQHPGVGELKDSLRLALNCQFVNDAEPLSDGDDFALIPPVSGG